VALRLRKADKILRDPVPLDGPRVPTPEEEVTARWRDATALLGPRDGRPYDPRKPYAAGDVLLHKAYGMGIVEGVLSDNAATALFRDGLHEIEMNLDIDPLMPARILINPSRYRNR